MKIRQYKAKPKNINKANGRAYSGRAMDGPNQAVPWASLIGPGHRWAGSLKS